MLFGRSLRESETTIKIKFCVFQGGWAGGAERKIVQNAIFRGKRHDNKILKVKILLSRNFVVMAQAPRRIEIIQFFFPAIIFAIADTRRPPDYSSSLCPPKTFSI